MSVETLHDKARRLGIGAMYEKHAGRGDFADLFDHASDAWRATSVVEKVADLRAFALAGITLDELLAHYRAAHDADARGRLPTTLREYEYAGHRLHAPGFAEAAIHAAERTG